ncbi:MAG: MBL fold metallo-hydrolase [Anaerolineales bacterium]|uniref:MBL fold metallo-hydrolase n=1 Tax=Candidatus Villigracilis vicinus TaxID=3140679 RepID=UPI0031366BD3|nr:MBL fold metallo-hydrolase [Anaerolineales bacterium]
MKDFIVIETPGHSAGHICFWREHDGVLIAGDVLRNINFFTTLPEFDEPLTVFTTDSEENRKSIKKIAALKPQVICFGHGPVIRSAERIQEFANRL